MPGLRTGVRSWSRTAWTTCWGGRASARWKGSTRTPSVAFRWWRPRGATRSCARAEAPVPRPSRARMLESRSPREDLRSMAEADPAAAARGRAARSRAAVAAPPHPSKATAPAKRTRPTRPRAPAQQEPARDFAPSRYIARVSRRTGKEVPGPIEPDELLVHAHRDRHPAEVVAQFLGSRFIQLTGRERLVGDALRGINSLGSG